MQGELITLRIIHVFAGVLWAGAVSYTTFFLGPVLAAVGPAAGPVMAGLAKRKLFIFLPVVGALSILTGFRLLQLASGNFGPEYLGTTMGRAYLLSLAVALLAFLIGMIWGRPAMLRAISLGGQLEGASAESRAAIVAEMGVLRVRATSAMRAVTALVLVVVLLMSVARYL